MFNVKKLLPLDKIGVKMRAIMMILVCGMTMSFAFAQEGKGDVNKETVLQSIDKNTDLAFVYLNGDLIEKGVLVNGKREGVWQSFNSDGTIATEASFSKGLKNGVWNIYEDAGLKYVLHYQNGFRVQANNLAIAD